METVKYYGDLNSMAHDLGKIYLTIDELYDKGISHVLVKGEGKLKLNLLVTKEQAINVVNDDYYSIIEEKIPEYRGVYGYFNADTKKLKKLIEDSEDLLTLIMEYEGTYININSGIYEGMVIIGSNYSNLKFKNIMNA